MATLSSHWGLWTPAPSSVPMLRGFRKGSQGSFICPWLSAWCSLLPSLALPLTGSLLSARSQALCWMLRQPEMEKTRSLRPAQDLAVLVGGPDSSRSLSKNRTPRQSFFQKKLKFCWGEYYLEGAGVAEERGRDAQRDLCLEKALAGCKTVHHGWWGLEDRQVRGHFRLKGRVWRARHWNGRFHADQTFRCFQMGPFHSLLKEFQIFVWGNEWIFFFNFTQSSV